MQETKAPRPNLTISACTIALIMLTLIVVALSGCVHEKAKPEFRSWKYDFQPRNVGICLFDVRPISERCLYIWVAKDEEIAIYTISDSYPDMGDTQSPNFVSDNDGNGTPDLPRKGDQVWYARLSLERRGINIYATCVSTNEEGLRLLTERIVNRYMRVEAPE